MRDFDQVLASLGHAVSSSATPALVAGSRWLRRYGGARDPERQESVFFSGAAGGVSGARTVLEYAGAASDNRRMRARTSSADPVGRAAELAMFPQFLDSVEQGPAALVLEGDAGIGKTVLWATAVALAGERGYRVLSSRPAEAETALPFAALGDL